MNNVRALGKVGDVKIVRDGYARNYLIPHDLARPATAGNMKEVETFKAKRLAAWELAQAQAREVADKLKNATLEITASANEKGTLFAAIEPEQVATLISEKAGAAIDAKHIILSGPIKSIGVHEFTLELTDEVTVTMSLTVTPPQS